MDGQAVMEILGVLVVAFVGLVIVPLSLLFLFVKYRGASEQLYQTAAAIRAGKVTELLPWGPSSLGELTREWVGHQSFTKSMFGRHDQGAGRVPSGRAPSGWLLAFSMEAKNNSAEGRVRAMTSAHRLDLRISGGVCKAAINGAALGSYRLGDGALLGPDGAQVGTYQREFREGRLLVGGRSLATIGTSAGPALERAASPTFLITHLMPERTPEDEAWALALAVLQLCWVGPIEG